VRIRDIFRLALGPSAEDRWPAAARLRWFTVARLVMLPVTIALNLSLWASMRGDPSVRTEVIDVFAVLNNGLLALDLLLTALFLRGKQRSDRAAVATILVGGMLEITATIIYIQMTGTATSLLLGTHLTLAFLYRFVINWWAGLVTFATAAVGFVTAYLLEQAGVLRRASAFVDDITPALLPPGYERSAFTAHCMAMAGFFVIVNLVARSLERSRADLAAARAELAAVVDEARLGRMSGSRLGEYQLGELLGRGGMGEVYVAHTDDGTAVACKVLHAHLGADTAARARFRREAELVQRLPADAVARVLEVGVGPGGTDFIAMELLHGEDLGALLRRRGRLTVEETAVLAASIAAPLVAAHDADVIHRDLKPSNVFLVDDRLDRVRLLDFGIARLYEGHTSLGGATLTETAAVVGSPGYMPPEQAVGDHDAIGPATDVFALGAILYRAVTGQPAFPSRSPAAAVFESIHHLPVAPSALAPVPLGVDRVLGVALAKDPRHRYPSPQRLADDFARAAAGGTMDELVGRDSGVSGVSAAAPTLTDGVPDAPPAVEAR
jgi:serine/threonine protein kinase